MQIFQHIYFKLLILVIFSIFLSECSNKKEKLSSIKEKITFNNNIKPQIEKTQTTTDIQANNTRSLIESLVFDTIIPIKTKFEMIFYNTLLTNKNLTVCFIDDPTYRFIKQNSCDLKKYTFIENLQALKDSIKSKKVNLNLHSIEFLKDSNYSSYKIKFKNLKSTEYKWKTNEEELYEFVGYYPEIEYYWFRENEFEGGMKDFLVSSKNGEEVMFIPFFSCNGQYFYKIESGNGYADIQYLEIILGEKLSKPIVNLYYEYFPFKFKNYETNEFKEYPKNSQFNFDNIKWLNNDDLIFEFNHFIIQENDTLFKDSLQVKISIKNTKNS